MEHVSSMTGIMHSSGHVVQMMSSHAVPHMKLLSGREMCQMQCDVYILHTDARNGFGRAVVSVMPGDLPFPLLYSWFLKQNYKDADGATKQYRIVDRLPGAAQYPAVLDVVEYYDGILNAGVNRVWKKTDYAA